MLQRNTSLINDENSPFWHDFRNILVFLRCFVKCRLSLGSVLLVNKHEITLRRNSQFCSNSAFSRDWFYTNLSYLIIFDHFIKLQIRNSGKEFFFLFINLMEKLITFPRFFLNCFASFSWISLNSIDSSLFFLFLKISGDASPTRWRSCVSSRCRPKWTPISTPRSSTIKSSRTVDMRLVLRKLKYIYMNKRCDLINSTCVLFTEIMQLLY